MTVSEVNVDVFCFLIITWQMCCMIMIKFIDYDAWTILQSVTCCCITFIVQIACCQ